MSENILVYVTLKDGKIDLASRKLLSLARGLAQKVTAVALPGANLEEYGAYGVKKLVEVTGIAPERFCLGVVVAQALREVLANVPSRAVLLASTAVGKQACAYLGAWENTVASTEVNQLSYDEGILTAEKSVLGGTWQSRFTLEGNAPVIAMRTTTLADQPVTEPEAVEVETLALEEGSISAGIKVKNRQLNDASLANLADAEIAVCVGRGTHGDFTKAKALADRLNASLGATRVACEEGWIDRSAQVGQSGISISPNLYIGLGISGDQHHVCGIRGAKTIVAVNDDPQAEIFELCDFAVVGDLDTVLEQTLAELDK